MVGCRDSVHPRAGGEHSVTVWVCCEMSGSSPRGRGTPTNTGNQSAASGFIPARAGNTGRGAKALRPRTVHPRAGGEHHGVGQDVSRPIGSSPRGRGTRMAVPEVSITERFIPARAGNTTPSTSNFTPRTVHPRAGGEHRRSQRPAQAADGSSPRGRGTLIPKLIVI